jgi:hypothetical protein
MDRVDGNQDRAAKAFEQTAKAFQQAAKSFEQTASAFGLPDEHGDREDRSRGRKDHGPGPTAGLFDDTTRDFQLATLAGVVLLIAVIVLLLVEPPPPPEYTGVSDGLVFVRCDEPALALFRPSVDVWQVSDGFGGVGGAGDRVAVQQHHEADLPAHSELAYPCDTVGGLARRLFDADFTHTVVTIHDPETGADQVYLVDLTGVDEPDKLSPDPTTEHAPLPHDDLAVFGQDRTTVWYRSANSETVHVAAVDDPAANVGEDGRSEPVALLDAEAVAFVVLDDAKRLIVAQGDPSADEYTAELALPNPTGDLAFSPGTLQTADEEALVELTCDAFADASALCAGRPGYAPVALRPAAWLDDRTLIAIVDQADGGDNLVRVEVDELDRLWACPAVPRSDWTYLAVAGDPNGDAFVFLAERNGERVLFRKETALDGDQQPTAISDPLDLPGGAQLVAWAPAGTDTAIVPHICSTGG